MVEYIGPSPVSAIILSSVKCKTREWITDQSTLKWRYAQKFKGSKEFLETIEMTSLHRIRNLQKPLLTYTIDTITGHGPFRSHLVKLKLRDDYLARTVVQSRTHRCTMSTTCPKFTKTTDISQCPNPNPL